MATPAEGATLAEIGEFQCFSEFAMAFVLKEGTLENN